MGAGSAFGSSESQIWYQNYAHDAFPHEAVFGEEESRKQSVDGRIHHIKGEDGCGGREPRTFFSEKKSLPPFCVCRKVWSIKGVGI
jgi:hypothetical protein